MKIGIITFWQSQDNYGQILQCYALQRYLSMIGHSAFLIRYTHENPKALIRDKILKIIKIYPIFIKILRSLKHKISKRNKNRTIDSYNRHFDEFRIKYLKQSKDIYRNISDLKNNPPVADCYIAGSDQVWAHLLDNKNNEIYYLNFGDKCIKRISYAVSFGMIQYPEKLNKILYRNLSRFDAISVREKSGVSICKNVGIDAHLVLDPTMLLLGKDYRDFIVDSKENTKYVFLYLINLNSPEEFHWNAMKPILKNKYDKIFCTTATGYSNVTLHLEDCSYEYPSIEKWLSLIYNSSCVITSSFHGVVFSILFNKPFAFIPLSGKYAKSNNRVVDLLSQINLTNRILNDDNNISEVLSDQISWKDVNAKIHDLRLLSQEYLETTL